ncbi:MAG: holo-ACP synthase [Phycisphaerales bacterium]|nr:holo-ACP synthase [Phycisphaerales bacterium]
MPSPPSEHAIHLIVGHGIDIVEIARIGEMLDRHGERFLQRCFCEREVALAGTGKRRVEHLAGRFAAKEAVLKAIGTGWRDGIAWTDMEIARLPSGAPKLHLTGRTAEIAADLGITHWLVSISHTQTCAVASAIGVAEGPS